MNYFTSIKHYLVLLLLIISNLGYAGEYYVKADASGTNDGSSWGDAFTNLQDALNASAQNDTIFVAEGIYYPDRGTGNRNASFQLKNGVVLIGGYQGNEEFRLLSTRWMKLQRDWQNNKTILSGDLLHDDNDNVSISEPSRADNSIHIITADGTVDSTTEINGFYIEGGNANIEAGVGESSGGAVYFLSGKLQIKNCLFRNNTGLEGGAIYAVGDLRLKFVSFINNTAISGGAVYFAGMNNLSEPSHPQVINSFFFNNTAEGNGGGIFIINAANVSLLNTVFTGNNATLAGSTGGGIYADGRSYPEIINCTIYNNTSVQSGGGIAFYAGRVVNSIIRGNTASADAQIYIAGEPENPSALRTFSNLSVEGSFTGIQVYDIEPGFIQADNAAGTDGLFGTEDDGLRLSESSAIIDSGNTTFNLEFSDALGLPRLAFTSIDLGAYERQRFDLSYQELYNIIIEGGVVLLFTHTKADPYREDDSLFLEPTDFNDSVFIYAIHDTSIQKNLTSEGIKQATYIGHAMALLHVNLEQKIASPLYRTKVAAREMFGQNYLTSYVWMWADSIYTTNKLNRLGTVLEPGINTGIVTHQDNIEDVTVYKNGVVAPGDLVIVKPLGSRNFQELGHITTDSWEKMFIYIQVPTSIEEDKILPAGFVLFNNYPNPFNPVTNFEFMIAPQNNKSQFVTLKIFDILGNEIASVVNEELSAGSYKYTWNPAGAASGVYFYTLRTGNQSLTKKLILLK